jgi:uncharacterized membrane protein
MPVPALILSYWLHLLATVVWLGGLAMLVLAAWPVATSDDVAGVPTLDALERRFRPWANISLAVLIVTGTIQMGGDSHYEGFLVINTPWSLGLFAKHIMIGAMIAVSAALQWGIHPALERARLLAGRDTVKEATLRHRVRLLTMVNLGLGVLVLVFTALITAL